MQMKAVIDRFEGDKAILLLGDEEIQAVWPRKFLPDDAAEGHIVQVNFQIDHEATQAAQAEAESLLQQVLAKQ